MKQALIFSKGIAKIPDLANFLPEYHLKQYSVWSTKQADCVLGWGQKTTTVKARHYAKQYRLPFIALEDGFLRSLGLGVNGYSPFSLVVDDLGIYYDTRVPSRLEKLILASNFSADLLQQARVAMQKIVQYSLSKYNHAPLFTETKSEKKVVLVLDQTYGDMAVKCGQADENCFQQMLSAAINENPDAEIWVKTHPDVIANKKKGYLTAVLFPNIRLIAQDYNPLSLLNVADKVYCVTSQMGFEALLLGKTVITFGVPWFAGWGLTDDRNKNIHQLFEIKRRKARSLEQLFCAAYLQYSRYINPYSRQKGTLFDVIDYLQQMRSFGERVKGTLYAIDISLWKRAVIKPFFQFPQCRIEFVSLKNLQKKVKKQPLEYDAKLLVWGNGKPEIQAFAKQQNLSMVRMEDGFIRSVGLGSNLVAPLSLVIDDMGIYFNAAQPSRLEKILLHQQFSIEDLQRAERLHQKLIEYNVGKYNVGDLGFHLKATPKKKILIPGQVEDDASIKSASPVINKNLQLLQAVREKNPEAYILYKPHPDVVSGNRIGGVDTNLALKYADEIIENANILDCISQVNEVHTMTSLAGFEALLRNKIVHCYGLPFYAGWGLTSDYLSCERRNKKHTLLELLAAVLIYYPLYIEPTKRYFITPERTIELLNQQKRYQKNSLKRSFLAKQWEKLTQLVNTFR